jgi:hypothetical protein
MVKRRRQIEKPPARSGQKKRRHPSGRRPRSLRNLIISENALSDLNLDAGRMPALPSVAGKCFGNFGGKVLPIQLFRLYYPQFAWSFTEKYFVKLKQTKGLIQFTDFFERVPAGRAF